MVNLHLFSAQNYEMGVIYNKSDDISSREINGTLRRGLGVKMLTSFMNEAFQHQSNMYVFNRRGVIGCNIIYHI